MAKRGKTKKAYINQKLLGKRIGSKHLYALLLVLFVVFLVGSAFGFKDLLDSSTNIRSLISSKRGSSNARVVAASSSAIPIKISAPTPAVVEIPANSGRSVRVPVVYYHYVGNNPNPADKVRDSLSISPDKFEAQMKFIAKNGYSTISYDTLYAALKGNATLPAKPVILTFDDGYIDFYVNAFPVLRSLNLHATVFIPTGLMDQGYYLHWSQIKEMDATGLVSFQAHSVHHGNLAGLSHEQLVGEIATSKRVLEQQLGKPVNFMAYPYGLSNAAVWEATKQAGFLGAAGTWGGNIESEGNVYDMPRIKVAGSWSGEELGARL